MTAVLVGLGVAVATSACTTTGASSGDNGYITGDGVVTTIAPADREGLPEVKGDTIDGSTIDVSDHLGQVVVINVWAAWCPPCRKEAPGLVKAANELPRVAFVGIDTRDQNTASAEAFVRSFDVPYDSIYDQDGGVLLSFYGILTPSSLPSTIVVDKQGRIAALVLGTVDSGTLMGLVSDVAAGA